jgi:hypothetical protein
MRKKYAEKTSVTVEKSKGDISKLLRDWKCDRIAWEEDFEKGHIALLFVWKKDTQPYAARLEIKIPTEVQIRKRPECLNKKTGQPNEGAVRKCIESAGRSEMRLLLLWLKAAFAAIDAGIIPADIVFMPFFVVRDGQTVSDVVRPNLPALISGKTSFKQLTA